MMKWTALDLPTACKLNSVKNKVKCALSGVDILVHRWSLEKTLHGEALMIILYYHDYCILTVHDLIFPNLCFVIYLKDHHSKVILKYQYKGSTIWIYEAILEITVAYVLLILCILFTFLLLSSKRNTF